MVNGNEEKVIEKISSVSGIDKEKIEERIEAKRAKLSGLISREGALQIIAAELGISFDNEKLKIDELIPGMRKANVTGKIINLFPVRTFTRNNEEHKVVNLILADDTSNIKVVLWDANHIELIEKGSISQDSVIEIVNASMRNNELHLGSFSELKLSERVFENVITEKVVHEKKISELQISDSVEVRAFIVQSFDPRFFYVCPECKKKATPEEDKFKCGVHGIVTPEKRALINVVLDDGSETIRGVTFHENLSLLGLKDLEDENLLSQQKKDLLGKELVFSGNVRMNKFFNNPELIIDGISEVNLDNLLNVLEK